MLVYIYLGILSMTTPVNTPLNGNVSSVPDVILFIQYKIIIITYYACTILLSRKPFLWRLLNLYIEYYIIIHLYNVCVRVYIIKYTIIMVLNII